MWANHAFLDGLQVTRDVFGRPLEDLWGHGQPPVWERLAAAVRGGETERLEVERAPGRVIDVTVAPLAGEDVQGKGLALLQLEEREVG